MFAAALSLLGMALAAPAPTLDAVLAEAGWAPTPELSAGVRPGDLYAPDEQGWRLAVPGCVAAAPRRSAGVEMEVGRTLGLGVRVAGVRLGARVEQTLAFADVAQATLPTSALQPTERCRDDLQRAADNGSDPDAMVLVKEVLTARITQGRAVSARAGRGAAAEAGRREGVASREPVAVGWRVVPLAEVAGLSGVRVEAAGPLARPVVVDPGHRDAGRIESWWTDCRGGSPAACGSLGAAYLLGDAVAQDEARGRALCLAACNDGDLQACANFGAAALKGHGGEADPRLAGDAFEAACDGGWAAGCAYLGVLMEDGLGRPRDVAGAARLFVQACDGGAARGCLFQAKLVARTERGPEAEDRVVRFAERACAGGDMEGCSLAGLLVKAMHPGDAAALRRARTLLGQACDAGFQESCAALGQLEVAGQGGATDRRSGRARIRSACAAGYELACGM